MHLKSIFTLLSLLCTLTHVSTLPTSLRQRAVGILLGPEIGELQAQFQNIKVLSERVKTLDIVVQDMRILLENMQSKITAFSKGPHSILDIYKH